MKMPVLESNVWLLGCFHPRWMPLHSPRQLVHAKRPGSGWTRRCYFKMPNWGSKMLFHADEHLVGPGSSICFCLSIMNLEKVLPNCKIIMYNIMGKNMVIQESSIYHLLFLAASFRHANRRLTRRNRMELPWSFRSFKSYQRWTKERPENDQKWCGQTRGSFNIF